jgi:outer membrane protein OmpA-like peptidoglycan-associated protein
MHSTPTTAGLRRRTLPAAIAACLAAATLAAPAYAQEFALHAEGGAAIWVDPPQARRFTPGGYFAARPSITIGRLFSLQVSYALLATPPKDPQTEYGTAHFITGGVRLRPLATLRPASEQLGGLFVDANAGFVFTGPLHRFGFDVGLGYELQAAPWIALGPFVRYAQIIQPDDLDGFDPNDAQVFIAGLSVSFGRAHQEQEEAITPPTAPLECPEVAPAPECPEAAPTPECPEPVAACPDADRDGICDADDRCPTAAGPKASLGCPLDPCTGAPLVVLVQFDQDSSSLPAKRASAPQTMDPILDAVAAAMAQDPSCRVCIVGHASEEGADAYNLDLSRDRAAAVRSYLSARGLETSRIPTVGFGERCALVPEATDVLNRRVEFIRLEEGESCPKTCVE